MKPLLLIISPLLAFPLFAQDEEEAPVQANSPEKYQITLQLSPTVEQLNMRSESLRGLHGPKLSYNFGIEYKHFLSPGSSFGTGALFQNKGLRNVLATDSTGAGLFNAPVLVVANWYINVPANFNWYIRVARKARVIITTGLGNAFLLGSWQEGKRLTEEHENIKGLSGKEITEEREPLKGVFRRHYLGLNLGLGFLKYIKSKLVLEAHISYARQLNRAFRDDAPVQYGPLGTEDKIPIPKQDSYAIDLRMGYYFNRQIKNYQKDF